MFSAPKTIQTAVDAAREAGMPLRNVFVLDTTAPDSRSPETPATLGTRHWTEVLASRAQAEKFDWVEPVDARTTTCCLNYSSGTTGVPKGVEISHYSYVANGVGVVRMAKTRDDYEESRKRAVGLSFLPMYHAYGQTYYIANFPNQGMPVYVMPNFDFPKLLSHIRTLEEERLELSRRNLAALDLDQLLHPIDDVEKTAGSVRLHVRDVTRLEPPRAVGVHHDRLAGRLGLLPVSSQKRGPRDP